MKLTGTIYVAVLCAGLLVGSCVAHFSGLLPGNPYAVLGVSPSASPEQLRRRYLSLCKQLHPDKNVHLSPDKRKSREENFKRVQKAYSQIREARSRGEFGHQEGSSPFRQYDGDFFRNFQGYPSSGTTFYRFSAADIFSDKSPLRNVPTDFKCTFVQNVCVSLADLYQGATTVKVQLKANFFQRLIASFRGGYAFILLYQSALYSLPLMHFSRRGAMMFGVYIFQRLLPKPKVTRYNVDIKAGYKGGTRLVFKDVEPGVEVNFVLVEQAHPLYHREGNDLHVTATLSYEQARDGCILALEALESPSDSETREPLRVPIQAAQIRKSGDMVIVPCKGWPNRRTGKCGDLVVHVTLVSNRRYRKRRQSRT